MEIEMEKLWHVVSFSAKLDEQDIKALQHHLYTIMAEQLQIQDCASLHIDREAEQDSGDDD